MTDDQHSADPGPDERLDEDEPGRLPPNMPQEMASPLKPFGGAPPPAPDWFKAAIAQAPERSSVEVLGATIEVLAWGRVGDPGIVLVHGNSAHADWWSPLAPFLAEDHRVVALSLSGMGGSDWREAYDFPTYAAEIYAAAQAGGLYESAVKPLYIGHSFGGSQVYYSAVTYPERMSGVIIIDSALGDAPTPQEIQEIYAQAAAEGRPAPGPALRTRPNRVYPTLDEALTRFRLSPPQIPGSLFMADYIARHSLRPAPMTDSSGMGWTWKFDPFLWRKVDRIELREQPRDRLPPMANIIADRSGVMERRTAGEILDFLPATVPTIVIPDSEHHIMVDQPLALVAALRALLSVWPS